MKTLLLVFLALGPAVAIAEQLTILADLALMPQSGYSQMKEPGCN